MAHVRKFQLLRAAVLIFFTLVLATSLPAKTSDYLMDVWTSDSGLPDSSVTSIAKTPDGYLWIGTYNGLARFDGVRFETFDPINTPELKNARVTGLFLDARGTLWINTYDGSMTSLRNGVFSHEWLGGQVLSVFSASNQVLFTLAGHHPKIVRRTEFDPPRSEWTDVLLAGPVTGNSVQQDGSGAIWYTVKKDLYRMVGTNSVFMTPDTGYRGKLVMCMSVDSDGKLWIGTEEGIARWNNGRFEDQTPTNGEPNVNVSSLYCTRNGCWVFADGKVRKCVDRRWVAEVDAKSWRDLVGTFQLDLNAYQDRDGDLWFTHLGSGLFQIKPDAKAEHFSTDKGLPSDLASCWFQDREGNIWVGLIRGGLVRLRQRQFQVIGPAEGLGAPAVSSVCEDARSNVWIGTFSGGLYRWRDDKLDRFALSEGAYKDCFFSAYPDPQNRIWLSAGREDLFTLENGQIIPPPVAVHGIKTILLDSQERAWLGQLNGLSYLAKGALKTFPATNGLNNIRSLAEDQAGGVWIGTGEGNLFYFEDGNFTRHQTHDGQENRAIWSILPEDNGTLWVGTCRGGLLRFKDGKFTRYTLQDGLPSDIICQILDDGLGKLWIGSHKGIFCVPKSAFQDLDAGRIQSLPCVSFGLYDGLPTLECSGSYQPACWRGHDGRLWFATAKGLVAVLPGEIPVNYLPPPVIIEEILVDGKSVEGGRGNLEDGTRRPPSSTLHPQFSIAIPPGKHQLDFRYTALSFNAPEKVAFRYRLLGLEEDWVDGGTKRSAHYGPLRPGKYRFQVIACNNDGVWNEAGAAVNLEMQPQFWQTWWFNCLVIVIILGIVVGTVRFVVTRKLQRKLEKLKQQQALDRERMRIARDLHDDLGATVTQVGLMVDELAHTPPEEGQWSAQAGSVSSRVRRLARDLDAVVWSVNPGNDSLNSLSAYLSQFFLESLRHSAIRPRLQVEDGIPEAPLKPEVRHHLFLLAKEAINNIIKHSEATEATLGIAMDQGQFEVRIQDNGRGFEMAAVARSNRNGLRNMRARAQEMGCVFDVSSQPGNGTMIRIRLPVPPVSGQPG